MDIGIIINIEFPFHSFHIDYLCGCVIESLYECWHVGDHEIVCLKYYELLQDPDELTLGLQGLQLLAYCLILN